MQTVLIVIHLMIVLALVVVVLLQKSEGGALGIGGGGGFMAGRSQSNPLTRLTAYLAAGFFATSIALTIVAGYGGGSAFDRVQPNAAQPRPAAAPAGGPQAPLGSGQGGILPSLKPAAPAEPAPPMGGTSAPAAPTPQGDVNSPPAGGERQTPGGAQTAPMPQDAQPVAPQVSDPNDAGTKTGEDVKQAPAQPTAPEGADKPSAPDNAGPPAPSGGQ